MNQANRKTVLTIAGSDPSGGAGIQADLKTFTMLGVYGGAAITSLTVQNTSGVRYFKPVAADLVRDQILAVLTDLPVSHIKIGMVGTLEIAGVISAILADFSGEIIYDPVLVASTGDNLHQKYALTETLNLLLNQATVITPNLAELEVICSQNCPNQFIALAAAQSLFKRFERLNAIVVKGGHLEPQSPIIFDHLLYRSSKNGAIQTRSVSHPRQTTNNLHGTGCTFSSAFTALHLHFGNYEKAFEHSCRFMDDLIRLSTQLSLGHGTGPLGHPLYKPRRLA